MNEPPKAPGAVGRVEGLVPAAPEANGLARTPAYWFSLGDTAGFKRIERLAFDWPTSRPLDGIDPDLAWLDVSRFRGTNLLEKDGLRIPDSVPMLVKLSSVDGSPLPGGGFGTLVVPRNEVLNRRAGSTVELAGLKSLVIELTPSIGLPGDNSGEQFRFTLGAGRLPDHAAQAPLKPVIAVIDDGCPFAHMGLRNGASTRVLRLWDQNPQPMPLSSTPTTFGYGSEWDRAALDAALTAGVITAGPNGTIDEDRCYGHLRMDLVGETFRHGAHMLGLAAGNPDPWRDDSDASPPDAASTADVLFVQLPRATVTDTSGRSLRIPLSDALRWIDEQTRVPSGTETAEIPVVINLSLGASAGPHDGSSLIEQTIDAFLESRSYAVVVIAAGNARAQRQHASWRVDAGQTVSVPWEIAFDDGTDSILELWWSDVADMGFGPGSLEVQLVPPGGDPNTCPFVKMGEPQFVFDADDPTQPAIAGVASVSSEGSPSASAGARLVRLWVAPTAPDGQTNRPLALAGTWLVRTRLETGNPVQVDAWIERDDASFGSRSTPSEFGDGASALVRDDSTTSNLANAAKPMVIGGYELDPLHPSHGPLDDHAGEGPGRRGHGRSGPDLVAPSADLHGGIEGVLSWGVHSGEWLRLRGTSAATAAMTRRIYNRWVASGTPPLSSADLIAGIVADVPCGAGEPCTRTGRGRVVP